MVHFFLGLPILVGVPDLLPALARPPASCCGFRSSSLVQLILTLGLALILSALTVHFRDIRDILVEPADVLVLRDADHLSDGSRRRSAIQTAAQPESVHAPGDLVPGDPVLPRARSGTGGGCSRWASARSCCSCSATGCSTGCATRSRRRCERWPPCDAIESATSRRSTAATARKRQFATLKSALLSAAASSATCSRTRRSRR